MRVLHVFKTYLPENSGGIERVIHEIASNSATYGVESHVFTLTGGDTQEVIELDGRVVHRIKRNFDIASTGLSLSAIKYFGKLVKEMDLVHYHFPWPMMDVMHLANKVKKPSVVTYHSDIVKQKFLLYLYKPLMRKFLDSVDRIVATSPNYIETSKVLKKYISKVDVIPLGLDKEKYPNSSDAIREKWRHLVGQDFFLFVGVFRYYKGLHLLIDAAADLHVPIVIVGAGPIEHELKKQVYDLNINNVQFMGPVSDEDKAALLDLSYAVVFPSHLRSEAFGLSLLEGAMYSKPLISSEIGTGTTYVNIDKETGLVVEPGNSESLSTAMRWMWDNEQEAKLMGRNAEKRYRRLFTSQKMLESYVSLYKELV